LSVPPRGCGADEHVHRVAAVDHEHAGAEQQRRTGPAGRPTASPPRVAVALAEQQGGPDRRADQQLPPSRVGPLVAIALAEQQFPPAARRARAAERTSGPTNIAAVARRRRARRATAVADQQFHCHPPTAGPLRAAGGVAVTATAST